MMWVVSDSCILCYVIKIFFIIQRLTVVMLRISEYNHYKIREEVYSEGTEATPCSSD